ncbi:hypothetical protein [Maritalea myrionectae]|uniref:CoxF protein n=1 Tax=Maritalea myrionectae TaxID=454601 RepID=A0A2R4MH35_9HYPH|nr:hypothetical protein [Maritalea myrionectae]AVX05285.1 hypothetical protein MXMO3_02774 [Maritalea myrionectae]
MSEDVKLTEEEKIAKRRRKRSIALALVLGFLAILFYAVTIVKIGPAIFQRPL